MEIECWGDESRRSGQGTIAVRLMDCSVQVIAEPGVKVPVLGRVGLDAAAWRIDVSCWPLSNNANSCRTKLPFGK